MSSRTEFQILTTTPQGWPGALKKLDIAAAAGKSLRLRSTDWQLRLSGPKSNLSLALQCSALPLMRLGRDDRYELEGNSIIRAAGQRLGQPELPGAPEGMTQIQ